MQIKQEAHVTSKVNSFMNFGYKSNENFQGKFKQCESTENLAGVCLSVYIHLYVHAYEPMCPVSV